MRVAKALPGHIHSVFSEILTRTTDELVIHEPDLAINAVYKTDLSLVLSASISLLDIFLLRHSSLSDPNNSLVSRTFFSIATDMSPRPSCRKCPRRLLQHRIIQVAGSSASSGPRLCSSGKRSTLCQHHRPMKCSCVYMFLAFPEPTLSSVPAATPATGARSQASAQGMTLLERLRRQDLVLLALQLETW